jgi:hypothetical protein
VSADPAVNNQPTVKFDTGQYVAVTDLGGLNPEKITLIAIAKRDAVTASTARIIDKGTDSGAYGLRYVNSTDKALGSINASGVEGNSTAGAYQTICQTYDLKNQRLFINGEDAGSVELTTPIVINSNPVVIGGRLATLSLKGGIAEVLIYNRALSAGERKAIELYAHQKYNIGLAPRLDAPSFNRQNGVWDTAQMVSMNALAGASVYYTTDPLAAANPSDPATAQGWVEYQGPVAVTSSKTIRAIAVKTGYRNSPVGSTIVIIDAASAGIPKESLRLWLRADTLPLANNSKVSSWTDLSGVGNDFEQQTVSYQPTYVSTVPALNGRAGVAFGAGTPFLTCKNVDALAESAFSIVAVVRYDNSALSTIMSRQSANPYSILLGYQVLCGTGYKPNFSVVTGTNAQGTTMTTSALTAPTSSSPFKSVTVIASKALHQLYVDGVLVDENAPAEQGFVHGTTAARVGLRGGSDGFPFKGEIAEILYFNKVLTEVERKKIDTYIAQNYIVSLPLPPKPKIAPEAGTFATTQSVKFTPVIGGTIHYSVDGNPPTELSPIAPAEVQVTADTVVKAIELKSGFASYPHGNPEAIDAITAVSKINIDPSTASLPREGLKLWLRADSLGLSNGAPVSLWEDQSGNLNHAIQENGSLRPTFIAASAQLNGRPSVLFTYSPATRLTIPKTPSLKLKQSTLIAVSKRLSGAVAGEIINKGNPDAEAGYILRMLNMTSAQSVINSYGSTGTIPTVAVPEYNLLMGAYNGATHEMWINGVVAYTRSQVGEITDYDYDIDIGTSLHGEIAEILVYDHALGDLERRGMQDYLYKKYGVGPVATLDAPGFSLPTGTYQTAQTVEITTAPGSAIHYTSDGTEPTAGSPAYTAPLTLSATTTVKALAVRAGYANSAVATLKFTYRPENTDLPTDDGTPVGHQTDSDGDGVVDAIEVTLGSNPQNASDKPSAGRLRAYQYDKLYQLKNDDERSYTYDREGNITSAPNP